ncbi:MAG: hypothetical protein AUH81_20485 [Candidatus Rokubacteria bacterium 13_1_40CM_4_69_5]|nr:MAG: hypothetical protein AUH81_20485 [Candidatus Rokubacteria bacterium 13_1_40CM_4_69_5]
MSRLRPLTLGALVLLLASAATGASAGTVPPGATWLSDQVHALTAPEMEGRRSGTPGGDRAAHDLADSLAASGLRPGGEDGTFFQSFVVFLRDGQARVGSETLEARP